MLRRSTCLFVSGLFLAACSDASDGSVQPAPEAGAADSSAEAAAFEAGGDAADGEAPATFTAVFSLLNAACADCHRADEGPEGALDLSVRSLAYAQLVGAAAAGPSCAASGKTRVVAGDPDASLLYEKVATTPSCGARMPQGGKLSAPAIDLIRRWILAGAKDD